MMPSLSRSKGKSGKDRVLQKVPAIYLGPNALGSLDKGRGVLRGAQRPGRVDILSFEPHSGRSRRALIDSRFAGGGDWDAVGIVLARQEVERLQLTLVSELVPGDVVLAVPEKDGDKTEAYVNLGDRLAPARLEITRARGATSARSRHRPQYSRRSR